MPKLVNHLRDKNQQNLFLEIAYGKHVVEGDLCKSLTTDGSPFDIYVQHKLGKREWNACKSLYWRGFAIPASDYAFHPGKLSSGNNDPVQGVDAIFNMDIPHSFQAWIRAKLPQSEIQEIDTSKEDPSGLYGFFETLKINDYNANGQITDFSYSANPAREVADLFLIEGKRPSSRIDWGSWAEWRDFLNLQKLADYTQIPNFKGFGLTASYYNGTNFGTLVAERIDAVVEFVESNGAPAYGLNTDGFSARFEGKLKAKYAENYTFYLTKNDGGRLWVNNQLLIDQWSAGGTHSAQIALVANQFYDIKVEWQDTSGTAEIRLEWESAAQPREVVPADRLYPKPAMKPNYEAHPAFKRPTRLDDAIRTILRLCNSTYQRVNGKYRFFCYEQLTNSTFTFDEEINFYPNTVEIEPADLMQTRNVWQATFRDLESQYFEQINPPLVIELNSLISQVNQRIDGELLDFQNMNRWQAYRLLEARMRRNVALNTIRFTANCESYPVLRGDRTKFNLEFLNLSGYETRVARSIDKSSETTADDREIALQEWYPSELVPELTPDEEAPSVPQNLSAQAVSASQINLSYNASTDNRGVAGYEIEQNGVVYDVGLTLTPQRTNLVHSTQYTFKVRAYDEAGNRSAWSDPVQESTHVSSDTQPPSAPVQNDPVVNSSSQITIGWQASTDNVGVAGYEYRINGGSAVDAGNVLSKAVGNLSEATTYTFEIRAYDAAGNRSAWSNSKQATTQSNNPLPDTPPNFSAFGDYLEAHLSWGISDYADGYEIEEDGNVIDVQWHTSVSRQPGQGYHTYRVRAYNNAGYSDWSHPEGVWVGNM